MFNNQYIQIKAVIIKIWFKVIEKLNETFIHSNIHKAEIASILLSTRNNHESVGGVRATKKLICDLNFPSNFRDYLAKLILKSLHEILY